MKKLLFISICLLLANVAMAQFSVSYSFGYGSYKMGDMKGFLENIQQHEEGQHPGLGAAVVDNFPAYMTHSVDVAYRIKAHEFGVRGSFYSTGGKLSKQDHTGEYECKVTTNGYRQSLFYRYYFYSTAPRNKRVLSVFGEVAPAVIVSRVKIREHLTVYNEPIESDDVTVDKVGFACLPQVGVRYNILPYLGFQVMAGYELSFSPKVSELAESPKIDWSGVRVSGGVYVSF